MRTQLDTATSLVLVAALSLLILTMPSIRAEAGAAEDPNDVFVEVRWSGFNVRLTASGWIGFVASEQRDDLKHESLDPKLAIEKIDSLLAAGFLWTLDEYPSRTEYLSVARDGTIGLGGSGVMDGGQISIRLKVGSRDKTVRIDLPNSPATASLMEWFEGFKELANGSLFRG